MLHKLENSGLPIYRDDETGKLALEAPLTYQGWREPPCSCCSVQITLRIPIMKIRMSVI